MHEAVTASQGCSVGNHDGHGSGGSVGGGENEGLGSCGRPGISLGAPVTSPDGLELGDGLAPSAPADGAGEPASSGLVAGVGAGVRVALGFGLGVEPGSGV